MTTDSRLLSVLKRHPILTLMNGICLIGGVLTTIAWSPEEWSLAKQVLGGLFAGGGFGFTVTSTCFFGIVVADDPMTQEVSEEVLEDHKH